MQKTILITGSTDGIGLETARILASEGHTLLLHGRNPSKLDRAAETIGASPRAGRIECLAADLSTLAEVDALADAIVEKYDKIDVLINNAGVYKVEETRTSEGLDVRFAVNTLAPYHLTRRLRRLFDRDARVLNLSSAAQAPVDLRALGGEIQLSDNEAYAQSKLALTMWSRDLALTCGDAGPIVIAINPGSLLASKMVKEAYGVAGSDLGIGAGIVCRAALEDTFADASGRYFDNDAERFAPPHPDALDPAKTRAIVDLLETLVDRTLAHRAPR